MLSSQVKLKDVVVFMKFVNSTMFQKGREKGCMKCSIGVAEIVVWCFFHNKFRNGLAGLNHNVFCNLDLIWVKSADKIV